MPTEFGQDGEDPEAEAQIVTHYEVYEQRPWTAICCFPPLTFIGNSWVVCPIWSPPMRPSSRHRNEFAAPDPGHQASSHPQPRPPRVRSVSGSRRNAGSANAQKWRTGCEGRISLLKRRHGLNRCRYKGMPGITALVGLGVIADNLINIGHALAPSAERLSSPNP